MPSRLMDRTVAFCPGAIRSRGGIGRVGAEGQREQAKGMCFECVCCTVVTRARPVLPVVCLPLATGHWTTCSPPFWTAMTYVRIHYWAVHRLRPVPLMPSRPLAPAWSWWRWVHTLSPRRLSNKPDEEVRATAISGGLSVAILAAPRKVCA